MCEREADRGKRFSFCSTHGLTSHIYYSIITFEWNSCIKLYDAGTDTRHDTHKNIHFKHMHKQKARAAHMHTRTCDYIICYALAFISFLCVNTRILYECIYNKYTSIYRWWDASAVLCLPWCPGVCDECSHVRSRNAHHLSVPLLSISSYISYILVVRNLTWPLYFHCRRLPLWSHGWHIWIGYTHIFYRLDNMHTHTI